jgi:acyl carrier protein
MRYLDEVMTIVVDTLGLRGNRLDADAALLGAVPELDSMAVISLITALENHFGFAVGDDEISASHFATLATLTAFVDAKLAT